MLWFVLALQFLATAIGYVQIFGLLMVFAGNRVFAALGLPAPAWQQWINDNMAMAAIGVFLMGTLGSNLRTSGAFEVWIDGDMIASKLQTGRVMSIEVRVELTPQKLCTDPIVQIVVVC